MILPPTFSPSHVAAGAWAKLAARIGMGVILVVAGGLKIAAPVEFYSGLLDYQVALPALVWRWLAVLLPWLEVLCGGALLADCWPETVRFLVSVLCLGFVLMLGQALLRGLELECHCFGGSKGGWWSNPWVALGRAGGLLAVSGWLLWATRRPVLVGSLFVLFAFLGLPPEARAEQGRSWPTLAASEDHSATVRTDGTVTTWGYDYNRRITPPAGLAGVIAIATGNKYTLALKADGTVAGWGDNFSGRATPPAGLANVVAIAAGYAHALALRADGTVVAWGDTADGRTTPPGGLNDVRAIAAGRAHSVAVRADGSIVQWGRPFAEGAPAPPAGLGPVTAVAAGNGFTLALGGDGRVTGWGRDFYGQVSQAAKARDVVALAAMEESALVLRADGTVGFLGRGLSPPPGLADVVAIAAGTDHWLAKRRDGAVVAWGSEEKGKATPPVDLRAPSVLTPPPPAAERREEWVDPFIGTSTADFADRLGSCMPGPSLPHASIYPSPETLHPLPSGYRPGQPIVGFAQLHTQGTGGNPSYGNFLVTPIRELALLEADRASPKADERARAYAYGVRLTNDNIDVELVPARHSVLYRFTYPESQPAHLMIDVARKVGGSLALDDGFVTVDPVTGAISGGGLFSRNWNPAPYRVYFFAQVSQAPVGVGTWLDRDIQEGNAAAAARGRPLGAYLRFQPEPGRPILLKLAVSFHSVEQAAKHLEAEIPGWDLAGLRAEAAAAWREQLQAISLPGADDDEKRRFYTAVWHAMTQPRDRTGDIAGYDPQRPLWDDHYTLWDTWQTLFPLMAIIRPDVVRDNINAFIHRHQHNEGGYVSPAFIQGREFKVGQGGDEVDNVIGDAFAKGIEGIDWEAAYAVLRHHAEQARTRHYRDVGWMASDEPHDYSYRMRSGSATLAFAHNDYMAAMVARGLGHEEDAARYLARSGNWRNGWDATLEGDGFTGFVRGRARDGRFSTTPATLGYATDFYEGTCWEYSYNVRHDLPGLIEKMGGRDRFVARLQHALRSDYIDFSNEPSFLTPWLFNAAGRPYLASFWADRLRREYRGDHLPGDDDSGAMSSLYVFLTAGFMPVAGQDYYFLHGPRVPEVGFHLPNGRTFTLTAAHAGPDHPFVQSARLNGRPLTTARLSHAELVAGGTLEFVMGAQPSAWGVTGDYDPAAAAQAVAP